MPNLTVTLSNNNTQVDEMRLKQQLDDKVWTLRINNQIPNASIKKNEKPKFPFERQRDRDNKKGIEIFEVSLQQFPPPNTQINKLKRLNFPLGKRNASKIRYRLLLNYNFLFKQRKQASHESDSVDSKAICHQTHIHETQFSPKEKATNFFYIRIFCWVYILF